MKISIPVYHITEYKVKESSSEQQRYCDGYGVLKAPRVIYCRLNKSETFSKLLGKVGKALNRHAGVGGGETGCCRPCTFETR